MKTDDSTNSSFFQVGKSFQGLVAVHAYFIRDCVMGLNCNLSSYSVYEELAL